MLAIVVSNNAKSHIVVNSLIHPVGLLVSNIIDALCISGDLLLLFNHLRGYLHLLHLLSLKIRAPGGKLN